MNSHEVFIHIHQGCVAGTGAIVRLPQCQWSKPDGCGKISQCITTTKHSKAKTVCIFLVIYCISPYYPGLLHCNWSRSNISSVLHWYWSHDMNSPVPTNHDDLFKWKHFPRYWSFVRGIHRSPVNFPHKGQWCGALMFSLICDWINGCVNNREADDMRRHQPHHHVIVMPQKYKKHRPGVWFLRHVVYAPMPYCHNEAFHYSGNYWEYDGPFVTPSHCNSFEDRASVDNIYMHPNFKWVADACLCDRVSGYMMTSSNGNIFRVIGHLCGEFTGLRWILRTKASDAELWYFLWSASE